MAERGKPDLYIVPTPIGNMGDMTFRGVDVLKNVDRILAEDTRVTTRLLARYEIKKPLRSYHNFNEHKLIPWLIERMQEGECIALVTDAGTPGISDPGFLIVRACIDAGLMVECLPGATALIPALVNSGLSANQFVFEGFLPHRKGRQKRLRELAGEKRTIIIYESPHRALTLLRELVEYLGGSRQASLSRELSKIHEETIRGTLDDLLAHFTACPPRGEIVVIIKGNE